MIQTARALADLRDNAKLVNERSTNGFNEQLVLIIIVIAVK